MTPDVSRFLEDVTGHYARSYADAIRAVLMAMATGDRIGLRAARMQLDKVVRETVGIGEILGATTVLRAASAALPGTARSFRADVRKLLAFGTAPIQNLLPKVTFDEAIADMVARTPVTLRDAAERTAERISQLYSEGHVVAFAKSAEQAVTERVQQLIAKAIKEGIPEASYKPVNGMAVQPGIGRLISMGVEAVAEETEDWSNAYSKMAFRTNLNTAVTAGRFRQAQDPDIKDVMPAFEYTAVGDSDTRPNHLAANGLVMMSDNPEWNRVSPPMGYACRCTLIMVSRWELETRQVSQRAPSGAYPDPGFRHAGRPDLLLSAVTT